MKDDEVAAAILTLMEKQKLVSEGAGAVPVAALMFNKIPELKGKKVCCLVSRFSADPGQLRSVSKIIGNLGGNVTSVSYGMTDLEADINSCIIKLTIETRNQAHIDEIKAELAKQGYHLINK